ETVADRTVYRRRDERDEREDHRQQRYAPTIKVRACFTIACRMAAIASIRERKLCRCRNSSTAAGRARVNWRKARGLICAVRHQLRRPPEEIPTARPKADMVTWSSGDPTKL